jgi:hypothetical protein
MKYLLLALFMAAPSLHADDEFKVYVNTFDSDLDTKSIESPKVNVTQGAGNFRSRAGHLPSSEEMQKIFIAADLKDDIQSLDQMQRDILYRKTAERDLASVKISYPKIPDQKLLKLKKTIEELP